MQDQQNFPNQYPPQNPYYPPPDPYPRYGHVSGRSSQDRFRHYLTTIVVPIATGVFALLATVGTSYLANQNGNSFTNGIRSFFQNSPAFTIILSILFTIPALLSFVWGLRSPKTHKNQTPTNTVPIYPPPPAPDLSTYQPGDGSGSFGYPGAPAYSGSESVPFPTVPLPAATIPLPALPENSPRIETIKTWLQQDKKFEAELRYFLFQLSVAQGVGTVDAKYIDARIHNLELLIAELHNPKNKRWVDGSTVMNNVVSPICNTGLLIVGVIGIVLTLSHH